MTDARDLILLVEAYLRLLKLSHHNTTRDRMQSVMASLVNEIAHLTGESPDYVQTTCEAVNKWLDPVGGGVTGELRGNCDG